MPEQKASPEIQFGDIARLNDEETQRLLRRVDTRVLAVALKGAPPEVQDRVFANVSDRVERMIREEMGFGRDLTQGEVEAARAQTRQILRQLVGAGQIGYPDGPSAEEQQGSKERRERSIEDCRGRLARLNQRARGGRGISLSTVVGVLLGALLLAWGIGGVLVRPGSAPGFVLLGAVAVLLVGHDFRDVAGMGRLLTKAFVRGLAPVQVWIEYQILLLEMSRIGGVLSLKHVVKDVPDPYLREGLEVAVDGVEPTVVQKWLEKELASLEMRHRAGHGMMAVAGIGGGVFGVIGFLLCIVSGHAPGVGPGDVRVFPLLCGLIVGGACYAMRYRLQQRTAEEVHQRRMVMMSIFEIQHGTHPAMLRWALTRLVAPGLRGETPHRK